MAKVKEQESKKVDGLIGKKNIQGCLQNNPNKLISNLTGKPLSDSDIEIINLF